MYVYSACFFHYPPFSPFALLFGYYDRVLKKRNSLGIYSEHYLRVFSMLPYPVFDITLCNSAQRDCSRLLSKRACMFIERRVGSLGEPVAYPPDLLPQDSYLCVYVYHAGQVIDASLSSYLRQGRNLVLANAIPFGVS